MRKCLDESFDNLVDRNIECSAPAPKKIKELKKTIIDGVATSDVNSVVKSVLQNNLDIKIVKIYYDIKSKRVTFFANETLDIATFIKQKKSCFKQSGKNGFSNYLLHVLENSSEIKMSEVSLLDIQKLYSDKTKEFLDLKQKFKEELDLFIVTHTSYHFCSYIDFNYRRNVLILGFDRKNKFMFQLDNQTVSCLSSFPTNKQFDDIILRLFSFFDVYRNYCTEEVFRVKSSNTHFFMDLNMLSLKILLQDFQGKELFSLVDDFSSQNLEISMIDSVNKDFILQNCSDLFSLIYFSIDSLPIWVQREVLQNTKIELDVKDKLSSFILKLKSYFK